MLQTVDAIKQNGREIAGLLTHQHHRDIEPVTLANDVEARPLFELILAQPLNRFALELPVRRHLARVESAMFPQTPIQIARAYGTTKIAPGHVAGDYEPVDIGSGKHHWKIQRGDPASLTARNRPDGL